MEEEQKKERWWQKLNKIYHVTLSRLGNKDAELTFHLNMKTLILSILGFIVLLIALTVIIIVFTPIREKIPGYANDSLNREVYLLSRRADSLAYEMQKRDVYFYNLQRIIGGYEITDSLRDDLDIFTPLPGTDIDSLERQNLVNDSLLREKLEIPQYYAPYDEKQVVLTPGLPKAEVFFVPLNGIITAAYDPNNRHYGVDIAAGENQIINSTLDGIVVFSTWSIDGGYTIGIQHANSYFSIYKHNASLLKREGDFVKAGEAIAILGDSGDLTTGPHLHFELWHNGVSLNPADYMNIEKH